MRSNVFAAAAALLVAQLASAQTFTDCNPTLKTCPSDKALGKSITVDFTSGESSQFTELPGTTLKYGSDGAEFIINKETEAPTIRSPWYIFFGSVEVVMKASVGQGIVSSFVLQSDDLDEVDWEWLGGDFANVQTNYFGKGNDTTFDRGAFHAVANTQTDFHTYRIDWSAEKIDWSVNGAVVRTLLYADAVGGKNFPQTPMQVKMGSWCAGSSTAPKGTVEWAGGMTPFDQAPFTMYVKSVTITDGHAGASTYSYGDKSGSWESIEIDAAGATTGDESSSVAPSSTKAASSSAKPTSSAAATSSAVKSSSSAVESSSAAKSSSAASSSAAASSSVVIATSASASAPAETAAVNGSTSTNGSASTTSASATPSTAGAGQFGANVAFVVFGAALSFFAL